MYTRAKFEPYCHDSSNDWPVFGDMSDVVFTVCSRSILKTRLLKLTSWSSNSSRNERGFSSQFQIPAWSLNSFVMKTPFEDLLISIYQFLQRSALSAVLIQLGGQNFGVFIQLFPKKCHNNYYYDNIIEYYIVILLSYYIVRLLLWQYYIVILLPLHFCRNRSKRWAQTVLIAGRNSLLIRRSSLPIFKLWRVFCLSA